MTREVVRSIRTERSMTLTDTSKLFVIVRADLRPGQIVAQACHAARQFHAEHAAIEQAWFERSNNLVVLALPDEPALAAFAEQAEADGIPVARFREAYWGDSLTGIALAPTAERLVAGLPLALSLAAPA